MASDEPTRDQVQAWLEAVGQQLDRVHARMTPLMGEQRLLEAREALLKDLLSSFQLLGDTSGMPRANPIRPASGTTTGGYVRQHVEEILRDAGGPVHINKIHEEFGRRGYRVPGAGKPVNLTAHLRASDTIVSPSRGNYALVEQVGQMRPRQPTRRKRRGRIKKQAPNASVR